MKNNRPLACYFFVHINILMQNRSFESRRNPFSTQELFLCFQTHVHPHKNTELEIYLLGIWPVLFGVVQFNKTMPSNHIFLLVTGTDKSKFRKRCYAKDVYHKNQLQHKAKIVLLVIFSSEASLLNRAWLSSRLVCVYVCYIFPPLSVRPKVTKCVKH